MHDTLRASFRAAAGRRLRRPDRRRGPAGISASLRAIENKLNYITLERDEIGGTVAKYPRQKLVMTSPVEFPMYGKFKKTGALQRKPARVLGQGPATAPISTSRTGEKVDDIKKGEDGVFTVTTANNQYRVTRRDAGARPRRRRRANSA